MELIRRDDALHIVDVAEDEHPYKVPGLFVTYSEYNQGWSDAVDFIQSRIGKSPTIDAVPIKFIDEVIEYLTKCRDYAIHEETKTSWDEQRQTLIMLLHEWAAWNECGRTGKYGERSET